MKRYDLTLDESGKNYFSEQPTGRFVKFADYESALARNEKLMKSQGKVLREMTEAFMQSESALAVAQASNAQLHGELAEALQTSHDLQASNARLRKALEQAAVEL